MCPRKRSASDDQAPDRRKMSTGGHQKMERRQNASCSPIQVQHFDCLESLEERELLNKIHVRLFVARQTCIRNTDV